MNKHLQHIIANIEQYNTVAKGLESSHKEHPKAQIIGALSVGGVLSVASILAFGPLGLFISIPLSFFGVSIGDNIQRIVDRNKLKQKHTIIAEDFNSLIQISVQHHWQTRYHQPSQQLKNKQQFGLKNKIVEKASFLLDQTHLEILKKYCIDADTSFILLKMLKSSINDALAQEKINAEYQYFDRIESKLPHLEEIQNKPVPTVFVEPQDNVTDVHTVVSTSTKKHSI